MPNPDSSFQQALAVHQSGDIGTAAKLYRAILDIDPQHADTLHMFGVLAQQRGNQPLALQLMDAAVAADPNLALAWHNRSLLLRVLKRPEDALASAEKALTLNPEIADAWDMAATLYREAGDLDKAKAYYRKALDLNPDSPRYRGNYAGVLMGQGQLAEAYQLVREAEHADNHFGTFALANIFRASGYAERAARQYNKASKEIGGNDVIVNEAMALLLLGEIERGFKLWATVPDDGEKFNNIPVWQGEPVEHLLLHEEQGLGDALQCVRYIPLLRDKAKTITLRLDGVLKRLMQINFPDVNFVALDEPMPEATARVQLMRLPAVFGHDLKTLPANIPYLHATEPERLTMREKIAFIPKPRFGMVWAGNPNHRNNKNRSLPLEKLQSVTEAGKGHGIALQKWRVKDAEVMASLKAAHLFDADPLLTDFAATAALIMELDLVISVDTSVAHLAGALGKPVWVLIPFDPDWRWMIGREDSPWYPTLRLFRQTAPGDWEPVLERMAEDLRRFVNGDDSVLRPNRWSGAPLRQNPHALKLPE
jgi:tetratricopeptide (TPR) repeat protein